MADPLDTCLACGGPLDPLYQGVSDLRLGVAETFDIARCRRCRLTQTVPVPDGAALTGFYERYYNFAAARARDGARDEDEGKDGGGAYEALRDWFFASPLYRVFLALDGDVSFHREKAAAGEGEARRLLDIGCNEGRNLGFYQQNGFAAEGLEINRVAAARARKKGFVVHVGRLDDFTPDRLYDVAVLSNVLEHAANPASMLHEVRRLLKPGGTVWISCPNLASWSRMVFGRAWVNWHVPFHIVHFDTRTLEATLAGAGFSVTARRQITPALWIAQSLLCALFGKRGRPNRALRNPLATAFLLALLRGVFFPFLWLFNCLGHGDCLRFKALADRWEKDRTLE